MTKPKLLLLGDYPEWDKTALEEHFTLYFYNDAEDKTAFLDQIGSKIQAIATLGSIGVDNALLQSCPNTELIAIYGVGYDKIDLEFCRNHHIHITNTPDVLTKDVADFAIALMLSGARGLNGGEQWVRSGKWETTGSYPLQNRVWGKHAGILGLGHIGYEISKRLKAFDMQISYCNPTKKTYAEGLTYYSYPRELAKNVDFLFVSLSASASTYHIINNEVLQALGRKSMIINISRGSTIDEEALLTALETQQIGFAALDVFDHEPSINPRFFKLDNVLLQPHQASATTETRKAMGQLMRENLQSYFENKTLLTPVL